MKEHNAIMLRGVPKPVVRKIVARARAAGVIRTERQNVARAIRWFLISAVAESEKSRTP